MSNVTVGQKTGLIALIESTRYPNNTILICDTKLFRNITEDESKRIIDNRQNLRKNYFVCKFCHS